MTIIDSSTIYCLATGKPIAQISDDEFGFIIDSMLHIAPADIDVHLERLCLGSMRPSLVWMNATPQQLESTRKSSPKQLLAYLMNRMYAPIESRDPAKPFATDAWFQARRTRIAIWQSIDSATISDEQLDSILFVLLELDSRFNLAKLHKPTAIVELWQSWSTDNAAKLIDSLWTWRHKLVAEHEKALRQAAASAEFWHSGNRLTRAALAAQFQRVTPPSPTKAAKQAKTRKLAEDVDFLTQLEKELTVRPSQPEASADGADNTQSTPTRKVSAPVRLTRFGKAA